VETGKTVRAFSMRDGRNVVLRTPTWNDLDDLLSLINSLVEEGANIIVGKRVTKQEEIDWLSKALASLETDEAFYLVAEVDGRVVGNSELTKTSGRDSHVGRLGIAIREGFRNLGIGTEMMKALFEQARVWGLRGVTLGHFATNERAHRLYQRMGFVEVGRIPKKFLRDGRYTDEIVMVKMFD
jgi:RimJ/RimL family protein N-acetyltransferase